MLCVSPLTELLEVLAPMYVFYIIGWKRSDVRISIPSNLAAQHTTLEQETLLTIVEKPDLVPSWCRC